MQSDIVYVALNNIRSLHNVGSIFRTSDALGIGRVILGGYTGSPPRKDISKTALGAEKWVSYEKVFRLPTYLRKIKKEGFSVVGLENNIKRALSIENFYPSFPLVLVLGNERKGLTKAVQQELDMIISIPMVGRKESLNVAVAFGIAMYCIKNFRHD